MAVTARGAPGIKGLVTRDAAAHPTVPRMAPRRTVWPSMSTVLKYILPQTSGFSLVALTVGPSNISFWSPEGVNSVNISFWSPEGVKGVNPQEITCKVWCGCPLLWVRKGILEFGALEIRLHRFKTADMHLPWMTLEVAPIPLGLSFLRCTVAV